MFYVLCIIYIIYKFYVFNQVLCALNFYAQDNYQKVVGVDCRLSITQFTVSILLQEVTCAINDYLLEAFKPLRGFLQ